MPPDSTAFTAVRVAGNRHAPAIPDRIPSGVRPTAAHTASSVQMMPSPVASRPSSHSAGNDRVSHFTSSLSHWQCHEISIVGYWPAVAGAAVPAVLNTFICT